MCLSFRQLPNPISSTWKEYKVYGPTLTQFQEPCPRTPQCLSPCRSRYCPVVPRGTRKYFAAPAINRSNNMCMYIYIYLLFPIDSPFWVDSQWGSQRNLWICPKFRDLPSPNVLPWENILMEKWFKDTWNIKWYSSPWDLPWDFGVAYFFTNTTCSPPRFVSRYVEEIVLA